MHHCNRILFPMLLGCTLPAQSVVSPSHFTNAEGGTQQTLAIGVTTAPTALLSIHEELQGTARTVRGMAFRVDGTLNQNVAASTIGFTVFASTAMTTAANPSATFSANHGADKATVASLTSINWPAAVLGGAAPAFVHVIPFAQPFAFGGSGPLCLEVQVFTRNNATTRFDYVNNASTDPNPLDWSYGTGCKLTGNTVPMTLSGSGSGNWPANSVSLTYTGTRLPPSGSVVLMIGVDNTQIAGIPLPFVLPGTPSSPSGACTIYNDSVIQIPVATTATGTLSLTLGFSVNPFYNGLDVYGQLIAVDPAANFFGVVLSNGLQHHLVAPYAAPRIGTVYSNSSTGPTGTVLKNEGYVVRIDV